VWIEALWIEALWIGLVFRHRLRFPTGGLASGGRG
jgi:hypothetical protein